MNKDEEQEMKSLKSYFNRAASWLGRAAALLGFEMGPVMKLETLILDRDELVKTQLRVAFLNSLKDRVDGELGSLIDEALNNGFKNGHDEWEKLTARHTEHGARILRQMEPIPLSEAELDIVISKDSDGNNATLGDVIAETDPSMLKLFNRSAGRIKHVKPVRTLDEKEIGDIVDAHLDAIPKDEVFAIVGRGSFTPDQLRKEVAQRTEVGQRYVKSVLQNNAFLEEAIRMKNIEPRTDKIIEIPGFDF